MAGFRRCHDVDFLAEFSGAGVHLCRLPVAVGFDSKGNAQAFGSGRDFESWRGADGRFDAQGFGGAGGA